MEDALTPVCGRSLDAETLSNTPINETNESTNVCSCIEVQDTESSDISYARAVPNVSSMSEEASKSLVTVPDLHVHQEQTKLGEVDENETSLKWDECSLNVSKPHALIQAGLQDHLPLQAWDLIAAFPQLLPLFRNEQEQTVNNTMADREDLGTQPQMHCITPVEILDNYLKTGKGIHNGELTR